MCSLTMWAAAAGDFAFYYYVHYVHVIMFTVFFVIFTEVNFLWVR